MVEDKKKQDLPEQLAAAFELTMHQLTLLGHRLPKTVETMTPQQLKVLSILAFAGKPLPMSELSARVGVTPGTLTEVAKRLVKSGHLSRERLPEDDRVVQLSLTPEGVATVAAIRRQRIELFREICAALDRSTCKALLESHQFIAETYGQVHLQRQEGLE